MTNAIMEKDKPKPIVRKPDVLKKINTETLFMIESSLLSELPAKLKPQIVPVRGMSTDLEVARPSGFLSSCLPVIPDSPPPEKLSPSDDESVSPLKKSFSFRDKFSRISLFGKDKEKPKWKTIVEDEQNTSPKEIEKSPDIKRESKGDADYKANKRFWFFRNKDLERNRHSPIYLRSKSFEFLPRAIEEEEENGKNKKNLAKNSQSYVFGSTDTMGDAWTSNESLEYISNVYYDNEEGVFLKSIKEFPSESSNANSSMSTMTSASSANAENLFKSESVSDLLDEFDKAVEMFSENYLSDCEPYVKTPKVSLKEKRRSASFSTLPSPKIVHVNKINEVSEDFKKELSRVLSVKRASEVPNVRTARRGSVTDWFVLEDQAAEANKQASETNKYRRGKKKPINRVRRMSSTKYWITPEECAVYTREQRPPLVIPRITQYNRVPRRLQIAQPYLEENIKEGASMKSSVQQYERLQNWSPTSERSRADIERSFNKANSDSPPFPRIDKRLGGSTENLLLANVNRSNRLQIPASSSGDSLDVEIRDRELPYARSRKSRSMVAPKHRMRSPIPAPRHQLITEAPVIKEGLVKRTKYFDGNKKSKKNWTDCYMVLTTTRLHFYKDQRTYQSTKGAELTLTLNNARVLQCGPMHTRRHTRSLVLNVGFDQYLIQDETEEGARTWFQAIWNVIYALYPNMGDSLMQQQRSNTDLESLGRTPPSARHAYRNKQKDEPVFGRNLDEVCPATSPRVPEFVVECVREIESSEENMCTDGLYRASGNLSQVQKIRLEIDQNNLSVIKNNNDIHVLTGSLKLFFRELKEPLIPYAIFDRVLAACSIKPRDAKIKEFRDIVQALPLCNRDTLKFLLEHLLRVTKYSERNRMHTANLAIVFGPTLLWAPPELAHNIAVDCIQQNNVVDILLNDFHDIFDDKNKKKA
ncbi:uncharacterized protein LOC115455683 isoform X3 [Manduca sexta]|uniref:uncharacterized protein LOC115455683 isoform X3 n=1 Tax=Manduca sexta TaxID=7130 RepID=UPI00188EC9CC|nr:uncharacterized protein LOC115455683 isoform X3 [Manduca sexta]